jgi:L,D-peptidoglycan transpeptidase YkuD (ErfK/YbiS/YcfS/YnhG family)
MSEFTGISIVTLNARLTEAQTALHDLSVGKKVVKIGTADKQLAFTQADVRQLRAYIGRLQMEIAIRAGQSTTMPYSVATWTR